MTQEEKEKSLVVKSDNKFITLFQVKAKDALRSCLDNNDKKVVKFVSAMQVCFSANPKLNECSQASLFNVFLKCAEWQLFPSTTTGECYVIPYKNKGQMEAQFQLGYQGMVTLAYRAGVKNITSEIVYENDRFDCQFGLNPRLDHVPDIFSDRGEPKGVYAVAILDSGEPVYKVMSKLDVFKFRDKSQSWQSDVKYKNTNSPWQENNDPMLNMWRKTCIRQLFKMLPKTPVMREIDAVEIKRESTFIDVNASDVMNNKEIAAFVSRMESDGYSSTMISAGLQDVLSRASYDGLSIDESERLEAWLHEQSQVPSETEKQKGLL